MPSKLYSIPVNKSETGKYLRRRGHKHISKKLGLLGQK